MPDYELTLLAEKDVLEIARYTIKTWGSEQADRYKAALVRHFTAIGQGKAQTSTPIEQRPELQVSRCEHHYVFSLKRWDSKPLILAVFHEKMDLMTRLQDRLYVEGME